MFTKPKHTPIYGPRKLSVLEMKGFRFETDPENPTGEGTQKIEETADKENESPETKTTPAEDAGKETENDNPDNADKDKKDDAPSTEGDDHLDENGEDKDVAKDDEPFENLRQVKSLRNRNKNLKQRLDASQAEVEKLKKEGMSEEGKKELEELRAKVAEFETSKVNDSKLALLKEAGLPETHLKYLTGDKEEEWKADIENLKPTNPSARLTNDAPNNGSQSSGGYTDDDISAAQRAMNRGR